MFRALTERSREGQDIRRPVKVADLLALTGADFDSLQAVVEVFRKPGRNFLMPPPQVELNHDSVLDISHESLIRQWRRLQNWVTAEEEKASMYRRLQEAAQRYNNEQGELWHGTDLALAKQWQRETQPDAVWARRYDGTGIPLVPPFAKHRYLHK